MSGIGSAIGAILLFLPNHIKYHIFNLVLENNSSISDRLICYVSMLIFVFGLTDNNQITHTGLGIYVNRISGFKITVLKPITVARLDDHLNVPVYIF